MASAFDQLHRRCVEAVAGIREECEASISPAPNTSSPELAGCGLALVELLSRQACHIASAYPSSETDSSGSVSTSPTPASPLVLARLDDIRSITYSKFYAFIYKDLPLCWRQLYTDASILKFCHLFQQTCFDKFRQGSEGHIRELPEGYSFAELVKVLDLAVILAGAAGERRGMKWIDKSLELLYTLHVESPLQQRPVPGRPAKRLKMDGGSDRPVPSFSTHEPFTPPVRHPIVLLKSLSMEQFQSYLDKPEDRDLGPKPIVIRGALEDWPARTTHPWSEPSHLLSKTFDGFRLVPVEIGRSYVDEGWGQKLVTFGEFLEEYIDPSLPHAIRAESMQGKPLAYLAQHPLFTQLPGLRNDILIPDYCYTAPPQHPTDPTMDQPELDGPLLNAWFGPPGTITPLHTDPYHNILAQVVGRKYVRLYSPLETERMYARGRENGVEMGNTSLVDIGVMEGWDRDGVIDDDRVKEADMAALRDIPFLDCILEPGDALYIPIGWWHYVRGLSVSFSVSFWWN